MNSPLVKLMKYGAKPVNRLAGDTVGYQTPKNKKKIKGAAPNRVTAVLVPCPHCGNKVKRLQKHLRKVHGPKPTTQPLLATGTVSTAKKSARPQSRLTLANEAQTRLHVEKEKQGAIDQSRAFRYQQAKIKAVKKDDRRAAEAVRRRFDELLTMLKNGSIRTDSLKELWGFRAELEKLPQLLATVRKMLTTETYSPSQVAVSIPTENRRKNEMCPGCGGDGGAAGGCYKCDGTGWI